MIYIKKQKKKKKLKSYILVKICHIILIWFLSRCLNTRNDVYVYIYHISTKSNYL